MQRQLDRRRLIQDHLSLVENLAARTRRRLGGRVELDELVSIGTLGLIQAALRYDGRAGNSFATYAFHRIQGAMLDSLGQLGPLPRGAWRSRGLQVRRLDAEPPDDERPAADEQLDRKRAAALLGAALERLPPRKRQLIRRCYYEESSLQNAGRELGVSKSWASRLHAQALRQLREAISELAPEAARSSS